MKFQLIRKFKLDAAVNDSRAAGAAPLFSSPFAKRQRALTDTQSLENLP